MAHDFCKDLFSEEQTRIGPLLITTVFGTFLLVNALLARWLFDHDTVPALLELTAAILLGGPLIYNAFRDLQLGRTDLNGLAALAVLAALAINDYLTAAGVAFFMVIAALIEYRSEEGARRSVQSLVQLAPTRARRVRDGVEEDVAVSDLAPGDVVRVRPGDRIPGDGRVVGGVSTVDEASITGESLPAEKGVGDPAFGSAMNLTGVLDVELQKVGEATLLGQVRRMILEAQQSRTPVLRMVDRYAAWYTPAILVLAGLVAFFTHDLSRSISVLLVACPCAIVLSAPSALVSALSAAARLGVLVKRVSDLEVGRSVTALVFDKTGTLTSGQLALRLLRPAPGVTEDDLLRTAAALEVNSRHPLALAVVAAARRRQLDLPSANHFEEAPGRGVRGRVADAEVLVGRASWVAAEHVIDQTEDEAHEEGVSLLHVVRDGRLMGRIGLADRTRPEAARAMDTLREQGLTTLVMVTGDRWSVARRVAREMHFTDVRAEVLPGEKRELVHALRRQGHVVCVVGDGVNDAPALAAGDMSVAMGVAGTDVAIHSASVALMSNNLNRIPFLLRLSRRTTSVVRQNLVGSAAYIVLMLTLSAAGLIVPVAAALLHSASTVAVLLNSARLVREGEALELADAEATTERPEDTVAVEPVAPAAVA